MDNEKRESLSSELLRQRFLMILLALMLLAVASGCNFDDFSPEKVKTDAVILVRSQDEFVSTPESELLARSSVVFDYQSLETTEGSVENAEITTQSIAVKKGSGTLVSFEGKPHLLTVKHAC